jgi:hypothetical protein
LVEKGRKKLNALQERKKLKSNEENPIEEGKLLLKRAEELKEKPMGEDSNKQKKQCLILILNS